MTTDREKSIELARGIFGGVYRGEGKNDTFVFSAEELEAFYKAAQAEAFEAAAVKSWTHYMDTCNRLKRSPADNVDWLCAAAIREMAKENGK